MRNVTAVWILIGRFPQHRGIQANWSSVPRHSSSCTFASGRFGIWRNVGWSMREGPRVSLFPRVPNFLHPAPPRRPNMWQQRFPYRKPRGRDLHLEPNSISDIYQEALAGDLHPRSLRRSLGCASACGRFRVFCTRLPLFYLSHGTQTSTRMGSIQGVSLRYHS
jgi:hypothetical protein